MNKNITKMYKNGMVTLDAKFFNVYQETIDSYIHNCYVLQTAMERLYAYEHQQMTEPCSENSRLTKMYPNGMITVGARHFEVYQETIDMEISDCEVMQKALKRLYDFETKQLA